MQQLIECVPNFSEGNDLNIIRQITDEIKNEVTEKINNLKTKATTESKADIDSANEELNTAMMKIGEHMKTTNDNAAPAAEAEPEKKETE